MINQQHTIKKGMLSLFLCVALLAPVQATNAGFLSSLGSAVSGLASGKVVTVVGDISPTNVTNALKNTLSTVSNALSAVSNKALAFKEYTLDGIAWGISKKLANKLTADTLEWASSGFDGSPAFIQNLGKYMTDIADETFAQFVYSGEHDQLCENIKFPVQAALATQYAVAMGNKRSGSDSTSSTADTNQCALDKATEGQTEKFVEGDFLQGSWEAWFNLTVLGEGDPVAEYLEAKKEGYIQTLDAQLQKQTEANWARGYLSVEVCKNVTDEFGRSRKKCDVTTPGASVEKAISYLIGEVPMLSIFQQDEFNEVISSLMSNLTNKALSGAGGLLGLSAGSKYSDKSYGENSDASYFGELSIADVTSQQSLGASPVKEALTAEKTYQKLQNDILKIIAGVEAQLAEGKSKAPSCFTLTLSAELTTQKENAEKNIAISTTTEGILSILDKQYDEATDSETKSKIYNQYLTLEQQGFTRTAYDNTELQLTFIDTTLALMVDTFVRTKIDPEFEKCSIENSVRPTNTDDTTTASSTASTTDST